MSSIPVLEPREVIARVERLGFVEIRRVPVEEFVA